MSLKLNIPRLIFIFIAGLVGYIAIIFAVTLSRVKNVESLPVLGSVEPFDLIDEEGNPFTLADLEGKVWMADFIFTSCAGPCPLMSQKMAYLQRRFQSHPAFEMVSFSVDPERDTPEVLSTYGEGFGALPGKWHFLTGAFDAIQAVAVNSFKLGHKDNPVHHSTYFALVDRQGNIREYFDSIDPDVLEDMTVQLHRLLTSNI